jgi:hypothetical protein
MSTYDVDTSTLTERPTIYNATQYRVAELLMPNIPTSIAGGAGAAVTVNVVFDTATDYDAILPADTAYTIEATPSQACAVSYSSKTTTGFTLTLTPLSGGVTLAAGTVDVKVLFQAGGDA